MRVYGGGSDAVGVRMDNPYSQTTNFVPSFEYTPQGAQQQSAGIAGRYPFSYQQNGFTFTKDGNLHEGDSFRGAMFFRGPTLNFVNTRTPSPTGGQEPTPVTPQVLGSLLYRGLVTNWLIQMLTHGQNPTEYTPVSGSKDNIRGH